VRVLFQAAAFLPMLGDRLGKVKILATQPLLTSSVSKMSFDTTPSLQRRSLRLASKPFTKPPETTKRLGTTRVPKGKKPERQASVAETLHLRVNKKLILLFPAETTNQPSLQPVNPPPETQGNLYVITAELNDIQPFAGQTVDWLITVARLLFQPLGTSSLYTFTKGNVESWLDREMELSQWRRVQHGEQLRATIYEFLPNNNAFIALTKMSLRHARSVTTNASRDQANTFCDSLLRRDQSCVISGHPLEASLVASHLIPRRLGDAGVQSAFERFVCTSTSVTRYNPRIGILLFVGTDVIVDDFTAGFWYIGPVSLLTFHSY
jgi:hypothetical protein